MKRGKRKKPHRGTAHWPLFFVSGLLLLVLLWIYWADIEEVSRLAWDRIYPQKKGKAPAASESILDTDKKQLEKILKQG